MNRSDERIQKIRQILSASTGPVSGTELARRLSVSRQVIVQDIAILKRQTKDLVSTNRGYLLAGKQGVERVFKVSHGNEEIEKELQAIVDLGAIVKDVFISHRAYGKITVELNIRSRRDVRALMDSIKRGISRPLSNLTEGYHYHTVTAESEAILDEVEEELKRLGFFLERRE